jgi:hypothetical protein
MVFKSIRGSQMVSAVTWFFRAWERFAKQDHPAYIPRLAW